MNITVLMGSPRKKDSLRICKEIETKLGTENISYNYIFLKDYEIHDCIGCGLCFEKNEKLCPCKDDLSIIRKQLLQANGIIFATPVYAYQIPAPLKRIIDRMSFWFHRQELIGVPALIVVTSDGGGHKQVGKYMKMTASGWGCNLIDTIKIISPMYYEDKSYTSAWGYNESYNKKITTNLEKTADKFQKAIESMQPKVPSFYDIFIFNCLRSKTFTSQADYDYWNRKGWLNSHYFYNTKLNLLKKIFGTTIMAIVNLAGRRLRNKVTQE